MKQFFKLIIIFFVCLIITEDWNPFILHIIDILQSIVEAQKKWTVIAKESDGNKLSSENSKKLAAENQKLLDQAGRFCVLSRK